MTRALAVARPGAPLAGEQPDRVRSLQHEDALAPRVSSVDVAFPEHRYDQKRLLETLQKRWGDGARALSRLARLHGAMEVESRCLALPVEEYETLRSFGQANDAFIREGTKLGAKAVLSALERVGLGPRDVDALFFTTVTGLATPTIDARLVSALGMRRDVRRTPMFGLGCVGGAAGLARASDYLRGNPDHVAVLLSVELCSLTLQDDFSVPNLVATGLFGDGAAAVVLEGADRARTVREGAIPLRGGRSPRVVASTSVLFPDTERVMGWDIGEKGFKVVLSADVPDIVREHVPREVDAFLAARGLSRSDVTRWICHPGGPKVISAIEESLDLPKSALAITRQSLSQVGNLSSASVLHVLSKTLPDVRDGELGILMAMGPGFCAELVLLAW
jgi:alkylresorcinol/alkylpyrone synthase